MKDYQGNVGLITKYITEISNRTYRTTVKFIVVGPPMMMKFTVGEFLKKEV